MEVYIVSTGIVYEGVTNEAVFSTYEKAEEYVTKYFPEHIKGGDSTWRYGAFFVTIESFTIDGDPHCNILTKIF
jgi:hypothetical protein